MAGGGHTAWRLALRTRPAVLPPLVPARLGRNNHHAGQRQELEQNAVPCPWSGPSSQNRPPMRDKGWLDPKPPPAAPGRPRAPPWAWQALISLGFQKSCSRQASSQPASPRPAALKPAFVK